MRGQWVACSSRSLPYRSWTVERSEGRMLSQMKVIRLSIYSILAGMLGWTIGIWGRDLADEICFQYLVATSPDLPSNLPPVQITWLGNCAYSATQLMLPTLIVLASSGLLLGFFAFNKSKNSPTRDRFFALLGGVIGLGIFVMLGCAWFFRD